MNTWKKLILTIAALFVAGQVFANELQDLKGVDANNNGTAANAGWPENMPPSDVNNAARALEGMIAREASDRSTTILAYGSANAIHVTTNRTLATLWDGLTVAFKATKANTGATTFQIGSLAAKNIKKNGTTALASGDIAAEQLIIVAYEASADVFQMLTPTAGSFFPDPMTTRGDVIIRDSGNATARLGLGAVNRVLASDGVDVAWSITASSIGGQTIWVPAGAMTARTTNGAGAGSTETSTNKIMRVTKDFDASATEYVQWTTAMPTGWDESTITAQYVWASTNATGVVSFNIQATGYGDSDDIDIAFGSSVAVLDTALAVSDVMFSAVSGAITVKNAAENDMVQFQVFRDVLDAADTSLVDALLLGVKLIYTTDSANDN